MTDERLLNPISTTELERRWAKGHYAQVMAERHIDALVMQNNNDFVGGYVRWFTDTPVSDGYIPRSVIFPASDLMVTVDMGGKGVRRKVDGRDEGNRGVGDLLFTPAFASVAYTHEYQAEIIAAELKHRGYRTVGWVGSGAMPHKFVVRVERELEGKAKFVDATEFIDRLKAIKSAEEKELVRRCAQMQDAVFARVLKEIKPGMAGNDITALAEYEGRVRQRARALPRLCGAARTGVALCQPPLSGAQAQIRRAVLHADREQRTGWHVHRDRTHHRFWQSVERTRRRLRIDERGAGPHASSAQAGRVLRRHRRPAR